MGVFLSLPSRSRAKAVRKKLHFAAQILSAPRNVR
jgi:hypothetical protein